MQRGHAARSELYAAHRSHQGGGVEAVERVVPRQAGGGNVAVGQPGGKASVGRDRGQPRPAIAGEDFLQQDRKRPAIHHDVVDGKDEPVFVVRGADQRGPKRRFVAQVSCRDSLGGAEPPHPLLDVAVAELDVLTCDVRGGRENLHGVAEFGIKPGRQVGVAGDDGMHRSAQSVRIEGATQRDRQLDRVHVGIAVGGRRVEEQPLLQRGQRQDVRDVVAPFELVDLLLAQAGGGDVRRGQAAAAAAHMGADSGQRLKPQLAQPCYLVAGQRRGRPRPIRLQVRAVFGVNGGGVELHRVRQRQRQRGGRGAQ
ncbi:hypothetical protein MUNTM_53810 [Mycobacterium sp. MUNTM1]